MYRQDHEFQNHFKATENEYAIYQLARLTSVSAVVIRFKLLE